MAASTGRCHGGQALFAYSINYLIDLDHAVIVEVEASTAIRQPERRAVKTMRRGASFNEVDRLPRQAGSFRDRGTAACHRGGPLESDNGFAALLSAMKMMAL